MVSNELDLLVNTILNRTRSDESRCRAVSAVCTDQQLRAGVVSLAGKTNREVMNAIYNLGQSGALRVHDVAMYHRSLKLVRDMIKASNVLPDGITLQGVSMHPRESGGGGQANIYQADFSVNGKTELIIVKIPRLWAAKNQEKMRKTFILESLLWRSLNHPNVLHCLGIVDNVMLGSFGVVTPYMCNGSLIAFRDRLNSSEFPRCLHEVAGALLYLHQEGIVHGDLHAGNVLIGDNKEVLLTDFGTASLSLITQTSSASCGAVEFLSPERLQGDGTFRDEDMRPTRESDVFAFGGLCYQLYAGQPPLSSVSLPGVLSGKKPVQPSHDPPRSYGIPDRIWTMMLACWEFKPAARLSVGAIVEQLNRSLQ